MATWPATGSNNLAIAYKMQHAQDAAWRQRKQVRHPCVHQVVSEFYQARGAARGSAWLGLIAKTTEH